MDKLKIFLASSEELKPERLEIAALVNHINFALEKFSKKLYLVKWEYLDSSMGPLRKQEEYNIKLRSCDICLILFWKRFGIYTKEEFETARERMKEEKPEEVIVLFKDDKEISQEIRDLKKTIETDPYIKVDSFDSTYRLKIEFLRYLEKPLKKILKDEIEIRFKGQNAFLGNEKLV